MAAISSKAGARTSAVLGTEARRAKVAYWVALALLMTSAVGAQAALDRVTMPSFEPPNRVLWVRSPALMRRLTLGLDALAADLYWIRAVQYYGSTKMSTSKDKNFDLLYPLLDMTTTLDPRFNIAYRFGAILLSEGYPNGPGRPDEAIALLEKGMSTAPTRWEYYHDAGFVEYWWRSDYQAASDWFLRASKIPGAPDWLPQVAASVLAEGGASGSARALWLRLAETSEHDWMRKTARRGLMQLDAVSQIEQLQMVVNRFYDDAGRFPTAWGEVVRVGRLPGIPVDPSGTPYAVDPVSGAVDVASTSELFPLRRGRAPGPKA